MKEIWHNIVTWKSGTSLHESIKYTAEILDRKMSQDKVHPIKFIEFTEGYNDKIERYFREIKIQMEVGDSEISAAEWLKKNWPDNIRAQ